MLYPPQSWRCQSKTARGEMSVIDLTPNEVVECSVAFGPISFQNPHDRNYCVPIPCRRGHTVQFVDLAEIADRLHVTTVHPKHELSFRSHHFDQPLPVCRKSNRERRPDTADFRQDAHEP